VPSGNPCGAPGAGDAPRSPTAPTSRPLPRVSLPPADQVPQESIIAGVRDRLGEQAFAAAWAAGQTMALDEAAADALAAHEPDPAATGVPPAPAPAHPTRPATVPRMRRPARLTAREVGVLALAAVGPSNREIAAALVLSERTVERHLARVYDRLGVGGRAARAAAVAYAVAHGLAAPPAACVPSPAPAGR
jgi:DNA-binding NarL/FixJ family response regulator